MVFSYPGLGKCDGNLDKFNDTHKKVTFVAWRCKGLKSSFQLFLWFTAIKSFYSDSIRYRLWCRSEIISSSYKEVLYMQCSRKSASLQMSKRSFKATITFLLEHKPLLNLLSLVEKLKWHNYELATNILTTCVYWRIYIPSITREKQKPRQIEFNIYI